MKKLYYNYVFTAALILGGAVMLPDYVMGVCGIDYTQLPAWGWWLNAIYMLVVSIVIFTKYGQKARQVKVPDQAKAYSYSSACSFMMLAALCSTLVVASLTWVLRNYISRDIIVEMIARNKASVMSITPSIDDATYGKVADMTAFSFFWIWLSSTLSMLFLGGMAGLISAAYVKRNAKQVE